MKKSILILSILSFMFINSNIIYANNNIQNISGNNIIINGSNITNINGKPAIKASYNFSRENRKLESFYGLTIKCPVIIKYKKSSNKEIKIKAPDNVIKNIATDVIDKNLIIGLTESFIFNGPIELEITGNDLSFINVEGEGKIYIDDINMNSLDINISGSSDIHIKGKLENLNVNISGLGNIHAEKLKANNININISGSGTVEAYASNTSSLNISGLGNVNVFGKPKHQKEEISGVGLVKYY